MIHTSAQNHQLEIIPLIQTFGHLEWLLKLREFELYRDDLSSPMAITPCLNASYILLEGILFFWSISILLCIRFHSLALLQQTLDLHPNSNMIHIGCDEVILTNSHPQCQEKWMDVPERYVE